MSSRQSIKTTVKTRSERLTKMKNTAKKVSQTARVRVITTMRKKPSVSSIENMIRTRGRVKKQTSDMIIMELSRELVKKLKDIYDLSEREGGEYVGAIKFTITDNLVKYNSPTKHTNRDPLRVVAPPGTIDNFIVYHSHPIPARVGMIKSLVSVPSLDDFVAFIQSYPKMQANIILERHGFYVIDILESTLTNKPNPQQAYSMFRHLLDSKNIERFAVRYSPIPDQGLYGVSIASWKKLLNTYVNTVMRHRFNMTIRYYNYSELPEITLLNPGAVTASMNLS